MLHFGAKPPFSFEQFLGICRGLIPENDFKLLSALPLPEDYSQKPQHPLIRKWVEFDIALRNELVKIRAARKHIEAAKYLRSDGYSGQSLAALASAAQRNPLLAEAEKMLDQARWNTLEELASGHYFDLDFLIIYAYKLLIVERWEKVRIADKTEQLEEVLKH